MEPQPPWTSDSRRRVLAWIAAGHLRVEHLDAALDAVDGRPPARTWRRDLDRLLLGLGLLLGLAALVMFIAANWGGMGRPLRFGLAEGAVVLGVAVAWWRGLDTRGGRAGVIAAAVAVGPLLALIGQTYQTGADPWQLFAVWLVLILPWVAIARTPVLVLVALALAHAASLLWLGRRHFDYDQSGAWLVVGLDGAVLLAWELAAIRIAWLAARWALRVPALGALAAATALGIGVVIDDHPAHWYDLLPMVTLLAAGWWAYRRRSRDLFLLAGGVLALLTLIAAGLGRLLIGHGDAVGGFLITGMIVTGLTGAAAVWLRQVAQEEP